MCSLLSRHFLIDSFHVVSLLIKNISWSVSGCMKPIPGVLLLCIFHNLFIFCSWVCNDGCDGIVVCICIVFCRYCVLSGLYCLVIRSRFCQFVFGLSLMLLVVLVSLLWLSVHFNKRFMLEVWIYCNSDFRNLGSCLCLNDL